MQNIRRHVSIQELISRVTGCFSISAFASLVCVPDGITSSAAGTKIRAITAGIKRYNSIIKKNHGKIVLLEKRKLHTTEALISKSLIDSYISHDEFVSINNALREYSKMKEEIKNPETSVENIISK